jgi:catechol 2,3-dioxygenase-like lactoylglutathione lyase family enzyme
MKLTRLMIFVPDLEKARAFYTGVLGFPVSSQAENHSEAQKE